MLIVVLMGCLGFTAAGTLLSSISIYARARDNFLPIVLLPVILPILLCAVRATNGILSDLDFDEWFPWIQLLGDGRYFFHRRHLLLI